MAWRKPGDPDVVNGAPPISHEYLAPFARLGTVVITNQPASQTVNELDSVAFTAGVDGTPPYQFQWFRDGAPVAGATNASLLIRSVTAADQGAVFHFSVSNALGSLVSSNAVLTVVADTVPPGLLSAEGNLNSNKITLRFSEPIRGGDATNPAHYSLSGGLSLMSATLRSDGRTVVLLTSVQTGGQSYTVTVDGLRDVSSAANVIRPDTQAAFIAWVSEEFVGPFPSWADLQRDYGAVGDGVADDTAVFQRALDEVGTAGHSRVLYVPAGVYRITATLVFKYRHSVGLIGEDAATTIIRWDGPDNEDHAAQQWGHRTSGRAVDL